MITLIAAIGKNNELGAKNALLWDLPADMKHFRKTTQGATVIMGRKTFSSIGRPLPYRTNIVLTRDESFSVKGVSVAHSVSEARDMAKNTKKNIFVIGGAQIYALFLPIADRIILTEVDASFSHADTFFPTINREEWKEISRQHYPKDAENEYDFDIVEYVKKTPIPLMEGMKNST